MILVDPAVWPWRGRRWAHLVSDSDLEELHAFAERLGVPRRAFGGDHYDVPSEVRERALQLGARAVTARQVVVALRAAGLRRPLTRRSAASAGPVGPASAERVSPDAGSGTA